MASVERKPVPAGFWGQSPQQVKGQSPWSGGRSPEAESLSAVRRPVEAKAPPPKLKEN